MKRIERPLTMRTFLFVSICFVGFCPVLIHATTITGIEFRGGGCVMTNGVCGSVRDLIIDNTNHTVTVTKDFSKSEINPADQENGGCGSGGMQGMGNIQQGQGSGGQHDTGGTEVHEELFERLPPIHMFISLDTTDGLDTIYTFTETIVNNTDQFWDGFLFALKRNEEGLAKFQLAKTGIAPPTSGDTFTTFNPSPQPESKKLEWSGGTLRDGESAIFTFSVKFLTLPSGFVKEDSTDCTELVYDSNGASSGYKIMLQEFPLITPVPEPGTFALLSLGLACFAAVCRKKSPLPGNPADN